MREQIRDKSRLEHILEAINYIIEFTNGIDFEEFRMNKMLLFAVVKNFEIIGEASYKLTNDFKNNHSEIEWEKIISMRHILVHGYYDVDERIVWDTVENLSDFKKQIEVLYDNEIEQ